MRNGAPRINERLDGRDSLTLTPAELKDAFGLTPSDRLTPARKLELQQQLEAEGLEVYPPLTQPGRAPAAYVLRRGARASAPPRWRSVMSRGGLATRVLIGIATAFVLGVSDLPQAVRALLPDEAKPMTGDLNVAVAPLVAPRELEEDEQEQVDALSEVLSEAVDGALDDAQPASGLRVQTRGASDLRDEDAPTSDREAERLARQLKADFVVYGVVRRNGPQLSVTPRFWVAPRLVQHATELTGGYASGEPLSARDLTTNIAVRQQIREGVQERARGIGYLIVALSNYVITDYARAERTLRMAAGTGGLSGTGGRKLLALFKGNVALKQQKYKEAAAAYDEAATLDPHYARAQLGRAEVAFVAARRDCTPADPRGLDAALRAFRAVEVDERAPDGSTATARKRFGIGRVELCQALDASGPRREALLRQADGHFRAVIEAARQGDELLDEAASESYGSLALMRWAFAEGEKRSAATEALDLYRKAIELSRRDDRRALYLGRMADMHEVVGDTAAARDARAQARDLERLVSKSGHINGGRE